MKKPKIGDMVRITYEDNSSDWRQDYPDIFKELQPHLIARGRFIGVSNGTWFIESCNCLEDPDRTVHMSRVIAKCITEVKIFGHDDSPLPEDLEDLLKDARKK